MNGHRRSFLSGLSAGLLGLVGFFLPRKAQAIGWRRRSCCPEPCPETLLPCLPYTPVIKTVPGPPQININFPVPSTPVPGGGGFCCWGSHSNIAQLTASASWADAQGIPVLPPQPGSLLSPANNPVTPCTWAFSFPNVASNGVQVTLTVTGWDATGSIKLKVATCTFIGNTASGSRFEPRTDSRCLTTSGWHFLTTSARLFHSARFSRRCWR
jgi:hypothetical protein